MYEPARDSSHGGVAEVTPQKRPSGPQIPYSNSTKRRRDSTTPSHHEYGSNDNHVRMHYNNRQSRGVKDRRKSAIYDVRTFNNFVKALLIDKYTHPHDIALDFACGKGGDLIKWAKAGIDGLIGIDIADVSIQEARKRFGEMRDNQAFWCDLCVGNCFSEPIEDIVHPEAFPVNTVSCQFALHYAFDTEERARCALGNISRALKPGGTFIGTIPNSDYLAENLRAGRTEWGNSVFRIKFEESHPGGRFESMYGNQYSFFLAEAVEDVPEFVIPFEQFKKMAKDYGLVLEMAQPFPEFFYSSLRDADVLDAAKKQRLVNAEGTIIIDREQLETCAVYLAFVFVKKS